MWPETRYGLRYDTNQWFQWAGPLRSELCGKSWFSVLPRPSTVWSGIHIPQPTDIGNEHKVTLRGRSISCTVRGIHANRVFNILSTT